MAVAHVIPREHHSIPPQPETSRFVSVEEYLHTSYEDGDLEYVDGHLEERNLGEWSHADLQTELAFIFRANRSTWGNRAFVESRL